MIFNRIGRLIAFYLTAILPGLFSLKLNAQEQSKRIDSLFKQLEVENVFNGNILIAEGNKVVCQKSFGYADFTAGKKNTRNSAFQIGSVSKMFTAIAILQLIEQNKINLNDYVIKHLESFPYPNITINQLLTHTSGLPEKEELFFPLIDKNPKHVFNNNDIIPTLKLVDKPVAFEPGSQWRYNNIGYAILTLVLEKVTGETFATYLQNRIFKPANMKHSYLLGERSNTNETKGHLTEKYYLGKRIQSNQSPKLKRWTYNLRELVGCTNIVSTVDDLLNFTNALAENKLISLKSAKLMYTPVQLNHKTTAISDGEFGQTGYGLGWFLPTDTTFKIAFHTGIEPGFFSFLMRDLKNKRTIIILDNAQSDNYGNLCKQVFNIFSKKDHFEIYKPKKSLFAAYIKVLYSQGINQAAVFFNLNKDDTETYYKSEHELNDLALELLEDKHEDAALEALKLCTILYPTSWNAYDSFGMALLQTEREAEAIAMYKKSLILNPNNEEAKEVIDRLIKTKQVQ